MAKSFDVNLPGDKLEQTQIDDLLRGSNRAPALGGWQRISICGEPYQLGFQHGYLLAAETSAALRSNKFWAYWLTAQHFDFFTAHAMTTYVDTNLIREEYLQELKGITAGMQAAGYDTSLPEIITYNCFVDLVYNAFGSFKGDIKPSPNLARPRQFVGHRCSAFVATGDATSKGQVVMAHNTWDAFLQGQHFNCIIDMTPATGHRLVMQASPGYIASMTDFVVTGAGLMLTETTIDGHSGFDIQKPPAACAARYAYQYADSIDDWWQLMLEHNNSAYANSWLVADTRSGEIARGEIGSKFQNLERTKNGVFYGQNIPSDMSIRNLETSDPDAWSDVAGSGARRVRWKKLFHVESGSINLDTARRIIADHYDEYLEQDKPGSRTICGHLDEDNGMYSSGHGHPPFYPWGALDAKVADSSSASNMYFEGRWGRACGEAFDATRFLAQRPQYDWLEGLLLDRPHELWQQLSVPGARPR